MSVESDSKSIVSTPKSTVFDTSEDLYVTKLKNMVKDTLKSRIFLGRYVERRLVNERIGYRDIVMVSEAEVELKRDLMDALKKLRLSCTSVHWIGITDNASIFGFTTGVCIWTEIDNQPFGAFWFQIKTLKFRDHEIIITLKCIRHITEAYLEIEPLLTGSGVKRTKNLSCESKSEENSTEALKETLEEFKTTLKSALTITNVKEFLTFIFALVVGLFTGSTAMINFLGNFILALVSELSILIKNSTPLFLGFLDFLSKIVGGFYILVAMIFRTSSKPLPSQRSVEYYSQSYRTPRTQRESFDDRNFN